jgi:asparagine synthase (glutamine-hydrolysing)
MCGLFGFNLAGADRLPEPLIGAGRAGRDTLDHRGPDGVGEAVAAGTYVGHRRLAILDLSPSGRQPMVSDDGDVAIAVNGEIYNFAGLRDRLGAERFASGSDSEVVLHGYRAWGLDRLLDEIDGMYALTIHDRARGEVHLARDRAGIKPMFIARFGELCAWASELNAVDAFAQATGQSLTTDPTALYDFLTYGYVPAPKTRVREVEKLPPGCVATLRTADNRLQVRRYWQLPAAPADQLAPLDDPPAVGERLRELVDRSVGEQLMSDVPVGFFLSGGLDSSTVVAHAAARGPAKTFAIGWDVAEHDETHYAEEVAAHCGTDHMTRKLGDGDSAGLLERMVAWYDEPHADSSILPTYFVSQLAREQVTVALTGDGGDELFGGYKWYDRFQQVRRTAARTGALRHLPPSGPIARLGGRYGGKVARRLRLYQHDDPLALYAAILGAADPEVRERYRRELEVPGDYDRMWAFRRHWHPELGPRRALQYLDFHTYLPDDILTKVDRASMSVSLEARVPLLSRELMEFAFAQPESWHYAGGRLKGGLKDAYRDRLPAAIVDRGKKGFSIPMHRWKNVVRGRPEVFRAAVLDQWMQPARLAS